jgi:4-amino-4-deoxy-L-arabinose transferase-like glycosyltransferase
MNCDQQPTACFWKKQLPPQWRRHIYLFAVVSVLLPRLLFLAIAPNRIGGNGPEFIHVAENLANSKGFALEGGTPDAYNSPLYIFFLAASRKVFGSQLIPVKLFQIGFDVVLVLVLMRLCLRFFSGVATALFVLLFSFHPLLLYYTTYIAEEPLLILFVGLGFFAICAAVYQGRYRYFGLAGVLFGMASLTKGTPIALPFLIAGSLWLFHRQPKRPTALSLLFFLLTYAATLSPWALRNYTLFGYFSLTAKGFGKAFYWGSDPRMFAEPSTPIWVSGHKVQKEDFPGDTEERKLNSLVFKREKQYYDQGVKNYQKLLKQPGALLKLLVLKATRSLYATEANRLAANLAVLAVQLPLIVFGAIGIVRLFRRDVTRPLALLLLIYMGYFYLAVTVGLPMVRYFAPALPMLFIAAMAGISRLTVREDAAMPVSLQSPHR